MKMDNPFAALVETSSPVKDLNSTSKSNITSTIEEVFQFTLNKLKQKQLLFLEEIAEDQGTIEFNIEILEHAIFERVLLTNLNPKATATANYLKGSRQDGKVILYLYGCFKRNKFYKETEIKAQIEELILRNSVTAFKQPELYDSQDVFEQVHEILSDGEPEALDLFVHIFKAIQNDEDGFDVMKEPFTKILKMLHMAIAEATVITFRPYIFNVLNVFSTYKELGAIMLDYNKPRDNDYGVNYCNTIMGALFNISVIPKTENHNYEFFRDGLNQATVSHMEGILWLSSKSIAQETHILMLNLLKCNPEIKLQALTMIGNCLKANADRAKIWNAHAPSLPNTHTVGDGFMINLVGLLTKLCQPFCTNIKDGKILKVDPTYCAVPIDACSEKEIHLPNMSKETCLVPEEANGPRRTALTYSFITECFFMAHRSFDIGFRVLSDKLVQINQEVGQIEQAYQETLAQSSGHMTEFLDNIKQRMEAELSKYLSIKCVMTEPIFLQELFNFFTATAYWLNNVAVNIEEATSYAPLKERSITFPLSERIPDTLKCIPEFVIENIVCYLIFLRRFSPRTLEEQGYERLKHILTFILVYMGSSGYTRNPHLRARLAEALEALLPFHKDEPAGLNTLGGAQRQLLFKEHKHRKEIISILLDVFVSIEMTGQSVQFEQKFNYRRPMYMIMEQLWEVEEYKEDFRRLAQEAELNMEAVSPPIFLRFINLLINDAIFLLDESLTNMAKLKELQIRRDQERWDDLPVEERVRNLSYLRQTGMMARFDNILGRDTIKTLEYLTSSITIVFTHRTMVDRVAAMLNYFLLKLVGPDKKNFKVKDQKEYSFDPAATVLDISKMYINLRESESFCLAVSQDGRSYSSQLFTLAEDVLVKIGGGQLLGELQDFAKKVSEKAEECKSSEEVIAEAPDHFLDPIMSTLMLDPVILPSSKQIVDRSTIARHLLSDQTDPFNRAPLAMDQVIPHTELANEIRNWLEEKKLQRS